ncbi:MAG TPA: SirB2 family protein [Casimicrobiaceae bacterium]|nr:SirB2 family protein [Casimicrobiaceae bacterium]
MDYTTWKLIHVTAVILSITGFIARALGSATGAGWASSRIARVSRDVVDTTLLVAAIALAWIARLSPLATPWLTAKIVGLIVYIVLGSIALKYGRTRRVRASAAVAAIVVFAYIASVAITKDPRGFLVGWSR